MQRSGLKQLKGIGCRRVPHRGALAVSEAVSSLGCSAQTLERKQSVMVAAWLLPLPVVPALAVAMTTGGAVTEDFGKLRRELVRWRGKVQW
jgi:hypothetical protein